MNINNLQITNTHITILKNTREINKLRENIKKTLAERHKNKAKKTLWHNACFEFQEKYNALVFDYQDYQGEKYFYELLIAGDEYVMEYAVCFIEVRPYFFQSGYIYQKLLRKLKHAPLNESQQQRYLTIKAKYKQWCKERLDKK